MQLYGIVAAQAPVAVVFGRAKAKTWFVARWNLKTQEVEVGAWFRGTLYPRRCDISPDGRLLCYFALKGGVREFMGQHLFATFVAVSKLPWLYALAAWPTTGTDTRGHHFANSSERLEKAVHGDATPLWRKFGLAATRGEQYAVERRRGWQEHELSPKRAEREAWHEVRVVLVKASPAPRGAYRLLLEDQGRDIRAPGRIEGRQPQYRLEVDETDTPLEGVMWADWDAAGRLLIARAPGVLQIVELERARASKVPKLEVVWEHDLSSLQPERTRAPEWARRW